MPTIKNKTNSLPRMTGDMGYGLGFFCGCLVGAVGTYLAFTPEGKKLKAKIIKEYQTNQQTVTLEALLPQTSQPPESQAITTLKSMITFLRQKVAAASPPQKHPPAILPPAKIKKKQFFKKK